MNGLKRKILLIDDDRVLSGIVQVALEKIDFEVLTAKDGLEGIERAQGEKPDLILLDLLLPKMNGYEVFRELKRNEATQEIPIIYLSAQQGEAEKYWALAMGAEDYVCKPFDIFDLVERIQNHIESSKEVTRPEEPLHHGFSFLEALFALLILSFGLMGFMGIFSQMTSSSVNDEFTLSGSQLANEKIEEIFSQKAVGGYASVALGTTVEDLTYAGNSFTRQTAVNWVNASDLKTVSGSDTGFKRVDVTVGWNTETPQQVQVMGLVSNY